MPFADRTKTENEAQSAFRRVRLIGMRHDAGIEQSGGFERIFAEKISADQLALELRKGSMGRESFLHFLGARLERLQQVAMSALEIVEHVGELGGDGFGIERKNPIDNVIGPYLIGGVEVARFG